MALWVGGSGRRQGMPLAQAEAGCQVAFLEWTDGEKLRHCTFVAMRDEEKPASVVRET